MNQASNTDMAVTSLRDPEFREYKLPEAFPLLVLSPGITSEGKLQPTLKYHFHNCIEIGFCYEQGHILSFENQEYPLKPGDFFVLSPFSMHYVNHVSSVKASCCQYLYVHPEKLLRDFYQFGLPDNMQWYKNSETPFIFSRDTHSIIYQLLSLLLAEYHNKTEGYQYAIKGLFQTIMVELTRELSALSAPNSQKFQDISMLLPALKRMHFEYAQPLSTALLAEHCHLSQTTFRALFRKHLGMSHGEYLKHIRLQKACELLYGTELSVLDISMEAGFSSLTSFYQSFRNCYHISPKKWRDTYRSVQKKNVSHSLFSLPE